MTELRVRPYGEADRAGVLAIFDGNLPEYFGAGTGNGWSRRWTSRTVRASW
ncbi:hypothetical protein P0F65_12570 [Sphingomonas sp. I4]